MNYLKLKMNINFHTSFKNSLFKFDDLLRFLRDTILLFTFFHLFSSSSNQIAL